MTAVITDADIREAALVGLRDQLRTLLSRHEYGAGKKLQELVERSLASHQGVIEAQIDKALSEALRSPEFTDVLRAEMLHAMRKKFVGVFDGVMHAAGKRAAQDHRAREAIKTAVGQPASTARGV